MRRRAGLSVRWKRSAEVLVTRLSGNFRPVSSCHTESEQALGLEVPCGKQVGGRPMCTFRGLV